MPLDLRSREAAILIDAANRDEWVATALIEARGPFESIGFALQQATEKRLKAMLLLRGSTYERTHDIALLLFALESTGANVDELSPATNLTDFAVALRYVAGSEDDEAALEIGAQAARLVADALRQEMKSYGLEEPGALHFPRDVDPKRIGRDEPCPCGSGLKFKSCHYGPLRAEGKI